MRKRLITAAIVAVVLGLVAHILSQPKKDSMEWHKEQWIKANEKTPVTAPRSA